MDNDDNDDKGSKDDDGSSPPSSALPATTVRKELFRKSIHIAGFSVPFIALAAGVAVAALFVAGMTALYLASEYLRLRGRRVPALAAITDIAMRSGPAGLGSERQDSFVIAPVLFAAGILSSLLIFPAPISYAAIAVVALGDGAASIAGRLYGRHKVPRAGGKTVEGTAVGAACAFAGALFFVSPPMALVAAAAGMGAELARLPKVDDNISVPLLAGLSMAIFSSAFGITASTIP